MTSTTAQIREWANRIEAMFSPMSFTDRAYTRNMLVAAADQLDALTAQVEGERGGSTRISPVHAHQQAKRIAWLEAALREYGQHQSQCVANVSGFTSDPCDCGFSAALAEGAT